MFEVGKINKTMVSLLGKLIILVGLSMMGPLLMSIYDNEHLQKIYIINMTLTVLVGLLCWSFGHNHKGLLRIREGYLLVFLAWILASILGTIPMYMSGFFPTFLDAFFETLSGFTATGITVLAEVEQLPRSILLWRSMTQWLGGMGIVVLFVAMLSGVGNGSTQLLNAEVTGPVKEKLSPRSSDSAKILWVVYVILTLLNFVGLLLCGVGLFDALNHAMSTISTGGYSTRNAGILAFPTSVQWVTMVFMFLSATSFALYYRAFRSKDTNVILKNSAWQFYVKIILLFSAVMTVLLLEDPAYTLLEAIRLALFNVIALISSTAFITVDFDTWSPFLQLMVLVIIFMGGCAGSTAGGVKLDRILILLRQAKNELRYMLHPRMITSLKINGNVIPNRTVINVAIYVFLFVLILIISVFIAAACGLPLQEAFTTSLTCLANNGPSFGRYGPTECFGTMPQVLKAYYCVLMLFGRLELYTVLVLFMPNNIKH